MVQFLAALLAALAISVLMALWLSERRLRIDAENAADKALSLLNESKLDAALLRVGLREWRRIAECRDARIVEMEYALHVQKVAGHAAGSKAQRVRMQ